LQSKQAKVTIQKNFLIQPKPKSLSLMKTRSACSFLSLVASASLLPFAAQAQLKITEVQSSEAGSGKADWWEVSNFGASSVDITGYKMDDNSHNTANAVALAGITIIAPGESVVFFESSGSTPLTVQGFRDWWGLGSSPQIGYYLGSGAGVSLSASGDEVNLYDSSNAVVNGVSFGTATTGVTFGWNPNTSAFGALSQSGVYGAYAAPQDGDIGSPGVVPEPSVLALMALGAGFVAARRRS
jgi:hypothetical protein